MEYNKKKENSENDEMSYAASYKRVISDLYNCTSWLHSYCIINKIALQKILKKALSIAEEIKCVEQFLDIEILNSNLEFFKDLEPIVELREKIVKCFAQEFTKQSEYKAKNELESRMIGNKTKESCCLGTYIGIVGSLMFCYLMITLLCKKYFYFFLFFKEI